MKKVKKGITLVEVIVAIAVFAVVSFALFSSVISMKQVVVTQEEYVKLEMICYDIDAYYQKYEEKWYIEYFEESGYRNIGYLTLEFKPTLNKNEGSYKIMFTENEILSISSIDGETIYVENVSLPIKEGVTYVE